MKRAVILISLSFLVCASCGKRVTQEQLIQEAVELKLQQWRLSERESCRDRAMAKAEAYVDSFLLVNSLNTKLDTIPKPPKPVKPVKPPFKERPDSLKVDKLFKKE
jgi:hypothetical protein